MILNLTKEELVHAYVDEDLTMKEVAEKLGVSVGAVHKYIKSYGIEPRRHMRESKREAYIEKLKRIPRRKGFHLSEEAKAILREKSLGRYLKPTKYGGHAKRRCDGYIAIYCPGAHGATKEGYKMEHIIVAEEKIGRYLKDDEVVHHINHNRADNRPENLAVMTAKEHMSLHMKERWAMKKGVKTYQ